MDIYILLFQLLTEQLLLVIDAATAFLPTIFYFRHIVHVHRFCIFIQQQRRSYPVGVLSCICIFADCYYAVVGQKILRTGICFFRFKIIYIIQTKIKLFFVCVFKQLIHGDCICSIEQVTVFVDGWCGRHFYGKKGLFGDSPACRKTI